MSLRLHLGCGRKHLPGYCNIDLPGTQPRPDLECDIRMLPHAPGTCAEILAVHSLEHLFRHDAVVALGNWTDLLEPRGRLIIEVPCLDKILVHFASKPAHPQLTTWGLYGEQRNVELRGLPELHRWCWARAELIEEMQKAGMVEVHEEPCVFHVPARDMRIVGSKP